MRQPIRPRSGDSNQHLATGRRAAGRTGRSGSPSAGRDRSSSSGRRRSRGGPCHRGRARRAPRGGWPRRSGTGQRARQAEADRADVGVGRIAEGGDAAAEHLGPGALLDVDLQPDDGFPGHQRTSAAAPRAASSVSPRPASAPRRNRARSAARRRAAPRMRPTGRLMAGRPARLTAETKMSARYIDTGSSVFSPARKAGVGVVGVSSRSTPPGANAFVKSAAIRLRTCCAFR